MNCYRCATPIPDDSHYCKACGAEVSGETGQRTQPLERDAELESKLTEEVREDFMIERRLGEGGMAVVFLARDLQLGRRVAIKVLPPELTYGPGLVERFKREARTAATLDHPHIVPIYRISKGGKLFWFAMKYVEGESLGDVLVREERISPERTAGIFLQVAEALDFAHGRGIIHRDIKPANIMLDARGWVTVTDFGIAKAVGVHSLTGSGSMIGTPYYMSPEQCAGGRKITGAADQYSLGVVAFQALSGHLPFTAESVVEIIHRHCTEPPPPLNVFCPSLPRAVVTTVERALAKKPELRFPSVTAFAETYAAATRHPSAPGPRPPRIPAGPVQGLPATKLERPPRPEGTPPIRRQRRKFAVLGLGGAVAAVGLATAILLRNGRSGGSPRQEPDSAVSDSAARPTVAVRETTAAVIETAPETLKATQTPPKLPPRQPPRARYVLAGVPSGASVTVDGHPVEGPVLALAPDRIQVIEVRAPGYNPWADTVRPRPGQRLATVVQLHQQAQEPLAAVPAQPPDSGFVSVGTRPLALISVNGRMMPDNPITKLRVPVGETKLRFVVTDSSGTWTVDTVVRVEAGKHLNLRRIPLLRHP